MRHNLRAAISAKFGTQTAFSVAVGIHAVRVNRLCTGRVEPTRVEKERIATTLGADPDWLFSSIFRIQTNASATA